MPLHADPCTWPQAACVCPVPDILETGAAVAEAIVAVKGPFKPEDLMPRLITTENPPPPGFVTVSVEEAASEMARFDTTPGRPAVVTASDIRRRTTGPLPINRISERGPINRISERGPIGPVQHFDPSPVLREKTSAERKGEPIHSGVMLYFPDALAAVARLSKAGNDKHNPGEPLHWARGKSMDQMDAAARHMLTLGKTDAETKELEAVANAWRALAELQILEERRLVAAGIMPYSGVVL